MLLVCAAIAGCSFPDYAIASDAGETDSTTVVDDGTDTSPEETCPSNGCGGCLERDASPAGTACGPCKTGKIVCATSDAGADTSEPLDAASDATSEAGPSDVGAADVGSSDTGAVDAASPSSGLVCSVVDDRTVVADSSYTTMSATRVLDHKAELAIAYPLHRLSVPSSLQLNLARSNLVCPTTASLPNPDPACTNCSFTGTVYICSVPSPKTGILSIRLMHGAPTDAAPKELAHVAVDPASISTTFGPVTFDMPLPIDTPPLPVSASIYFELSTDSTKYQFTLQGDRSKSSSPPPDVEIYTRTLVPTMGTWTLEPPSLIRVFPDYVVDVKGCF